MLAFTGLRFCHASALRWEDIDEKKGVIRIQRKQRNGVVGSVSRRKRAPREIPIMQAVFDILRERRERFAVKPAPGLDGVDAVVTKSITGHVKEEMREHYSTVALDEKRKAISSVYGLVHGAGGCEVEGWVEVEPAKALAS